MLSSQAVIILLVQTVLSVWDALDTYLPNQGNYAMAVGVVNDSAFIAGGQTNNKLLVKYPIDADGAFVPYSQETYDLPSELSAWGQSYVQHGNQLFIAHELSPIIAVYDMEKQQYASAFASVPSPFNYRASSGCLVHTESHLIVTGGWWIGDVYTYDIGNGDWDNFVGNMSRVRMEHSCVYHDGAVYVIAGTDNGIGPFGYHDTIEYVNLDSPSQWFVFGESLKGRGGSGTRSVVFQDYIVVIGGTNRDRDSYYDLMFILDPDDGSVSLGETLPYAIAYSACAVVQECIVCFGGKSVTGSRYDIIRFTANLSQIVDSQTSDVIDSLNYVLYGLGALLFASGIISLFAMLQNKLPKSSIDNANWKMAMTFAWQMFDFVSDINLTIELALEVVDNQDILLIICAIGCALFVIVPFITNLTMAARIKSLVANNDAAVSYFDRNSALFVSLCIVSGAVYPSLQLVSSRLFGLDIFDCGLTSYELKKMIHLKVMGSVVLENVPQVMFQVLYIGYSEGIPSNVVLLSLVASLLSIVAALMTWIVERNASNCVTVQYHIKIERKGKQLTKDERDTIKQKKERKKSLTKKLCQALSIQDRQMEIGYATINAFGFNYSVIHSVFPSEYGMNSEGGTNASDEEKDNEHVLAMDYVKDLYAKQAQAAVTQVFLDYFDIVGFEVSVVPVSALYSVANGAVSSDASNIELQMSSTLGDPSDEKDCETISK